MRFGRAPTELDEVLTSEDFTNLMALAMKHPQLFWGIGGLS